MVSLISPSKTSAHHHHSRPLTKGEKAIVYSVFGDALQLDNIRLKTAWWVLKGYAVSPNGHVYFHPADFCEDFSQQSLGQRAWLVHELTHIWQIQQGVQVFWRALLNRRYGYQLQPNRLFASYGVEQQARMVEDYYKRREQQQNEQPWVAMIPFAPASRCQIPVFG